MSDNKIIYDFLGIQMTLDDLERLIRWLDMPESKLMRKFLEIQRDTFDAQSERAIGQNAIADILNRERAISSKLAMKSVLSFVDDLKQALETEKENLKNSKTAQ